MKAIPREVERRDHSTWSKSTRNLQKRLKLSSLQKEVLIGTLLGDGCLIANVYGKNYRYQAEQSDFQKKYLLWKYRIFQEWCLSEPKFQERSRSWKFRTISHPDLTNFREKFYCNGKKIVPLNYRFMPRSPLSLAMWFMDDGTIGPSSGLTLNTQNFSQEDTKRLMKFLKSHFGLQCSLHKDKTSWRIYILSESVPRFVSLVDKFVIPEMRYKLPSL